MARKKIKDKNQEYELREGDSKIMKRRVDKKIIDITFTINGQHRRNLKRKSFWTCKPKDEFSCFEQSFLDCWLTLPNKDANDKPIKGFVFGEKQSLPIEAFGVWVVNGFAQIIGKTRFDKDGKRHESCFARFEYDANTQNLQWHGFIADPYNNIREIPDQCYLKEWLEKKYITNSIVKKFISK